MGPVPAARIGNLTCSTIFLETRDRVEAQSTRPSAYCNLKRSRKPDLPPVIATSGPDRPPPDGVEALIIPYNQSAVFVPSRGR